LKCQIFEEGCCCIVFLWVLLFILIFPFIFISGVLLES
jgi:hypothetical protein